MFQYLLIALCIALTSGADPLAQAQCRTIHHTDVDAEGTAYTNSKCLLMCSIHGKLWPHNMAEGQLCPGLFGSTNICKEGQCVAAPPPIQLAFADVCIQNATTAVTLPVANRSSCLSCETNVVSPSTAPVWNTICTGSNKFIWQNASRVTFEVWEQLSAHNHNFAGGATALVSQIVANGDNHKRINLPLSGGPNSGSIQIRVTWTPK